jgi:hypothetical protein
MASSRPFAPTQTHSVIAVRLVKKGEELLASDAPAPVTAAADLCLVKLLVGPGVTAEKDKSARSWSEGIGIEVWLPTPANWNERILGSAKSNDILRHVRRDSASGVPTPLDNRLIAQAGRISRHIGVPIRTGLHEASPVQPMMHWNWSLNLSSS